MYKRQQFVKSMRYNEPKIGQLFDQVKIEQLGRCLLYTSGGMIGTIIPAGLLILLGIIYSSTGGHNYKMCIRDSCGDVQPPDAEMKRLVPQARTAADAAFLINQEQMCIRDRIPAASNIRRKDIRPPTKHRFTACNPSARKFAFCKYTNKSSAEQNLF